MCRIKEQFHLSGGMLLGGAGGAKDGKSER